MRKLGFAALVFTQLGAGWRNDGSPRSAWTPPDSGWSSTAWSTPIREPGLASPAQLGDLIVYTAEPTDLVAVDAATGQERWRASHPAIAAMDPATATQAQAQLDQRAQLERELRDLQLQAKTARRAAPDSLPALEQKIGAMEGQLRGLRLLSTPPTREMLGWAAPSPLATQDAVFAHFANGVVAKHGADGRVLWQTWLGPGPSDLWGWPGRPAASPLLVDGALIVGHDRLTALDAQTGAVRWRGPDWPHYGSPTVIHTEGRALIATPGGDVVDSTTGAVVATGLGHTWYNGPHAEGDVVYSFGSAEPIPGRIEMKLRAVATRVAADGTTQTLWDAPIAHPDRIYATPLVHKGTVIAITRTRTLLVLDAATGALLHQGVVGQEDQRAGNEAWGSPQVAGDTLIVPTLQGHIYLVALRDGYPTVGDTRVESSTATPLLVDNTLIWRGTTTLQRWTTQNEG